MSDPGVIAKMTLRALTGHRGDLPNAGILIIFTAFLLWRVLLHLMRIWAPGGAKKISALASCSRGLKVEREWGTKLEILRNEKEGREETCFINLAHVHGITCGNYICKCWDVNNTLKGHSIGSLKFKGPCKVRNSGISKR